MFNQISIEYYLAYNYLQSKKTIEGTKKLAINTCLY